MHGLLLAAGAGRRMGLPKALVRGEDGEPWLSRAVAVLRAAGCDEVTVVLGARAEEARELLGGQDVTVVVADDWAEGMGASLRAGLTHVIGTDARSVLVHLVDLPDVTTEVARRVAAAGGGADALARATYDGRPGHPVLLGREHWPGVLATAVGDRGARDYLARHRVLDVECGDLATGVDVDRR